MLLLVYVLYDTLSLQLFRSRDMMNVTDLSNSITELFKNCVKYNDELEAFNIADPAIMQDT